MIWIHPFSGSARKNWPLDHYQTLARWLEATGRSVQFCTSPVQPLPAARVIENLAELASWLAGASLYIGNDSGITHLAAASGAPTVALFGPTNPQVWAPRGSNVTIIQSDLDTLSIEHVLNHAMDR
jgi:ADP-heptose:LPS heptosyltransferase